MRYRALVTALRPYSSDALLSTAPQHARQLIIFTGQPSQTWPSHVDTVSPLHRTLHKLPVLAANSISVGSTDQTLPNQQKSELKWDPSTNKLDRQDSIVPEAFKAKIYPENMVLPFEISLLTLDKLQAFLQELPSQVAPTSDPTIDLYVCTHGTRDCRCGTIGELLYQALTKEITRRKKQDIVKVRRIMHVGGHKWAGNVIAHSKLGSDWFGLLQEQDARKFIDHIASPTLSSSLTPYLISKWRGRAGLSQAAQQEIASKSVTPTIPNLINTTRTLVGAPLGDQVKIKFIDSVGQDHLVTAFEGESLMASAKREGLVEATCGGFCECASCHVYLPESNGKLPVIDEMSDEEDDQLEFAMDANDDSRLACQIRVTKQLAEWSLNNGVKLPRY